MKPQPLGPSLTTDANGAFYVGDWLVEPELNRIQRHREKAHLEPKVMEVLVCLSRANGSLVSKEQLIRQVWPDTFVTDDVLKVSIWQLRKAFQDDSKHPKVIETIPKGGYRLLLPVRVQADSTTRDSIVRPPKPNPKRWIWIAGIALAVLAVTSAVLLLAMRKHRQPSLKIEPFTTLPGWEITPSFSPDGNQIAFEYDDGKDLGVYVKAIGDEKMLRLTEPSGRFWCPQWSPDGRYIAYLHDKPAAGGAHEKAIYMMTPLGGAKRRVTAVRAPNCMISWSSDSNSIAYSDRPSPDGPSGVFVVDIENPKPRRLTASPKSMDDLEAVFSHSGRYIAFVRRSDVQIQDIYTVPSSGGEPTRLTFLNARVQRPNWTLDDKRVIFASGSGGAGSYGDLYSVPVDGGTPERLPFSSHDALEATISRHGDKLVYSKFYYDSNIWSVSLLKPAEAPRKLIASTAEDASPAFSPDGTKVAFASDRDGSSALWISNADGSNPTRLTGLVMGGSPRWSLDGRQIAFDSRAGGRSHIYLISAEGGTPVAITDGSVPNWSSDGKSIYFTSLRTGRSEVWKISLLTDETIQVTHNCGLHGQESPDGKTVYYEKPENPSASWSWPKQGVWAVPSQGGPERLLLPQAKYFWQVRSQGIYYVDNATQPHPRVQFFSFESGQVTTAAYLDKQAYLSPGLCISPDGRTLLYPQIDANGSDLMLVKNGRW